MKTARVIGAGMAGLAAAKVLSSHFDKVIVYDGNPPAQGHHLHVLLKSGQEILEKLFPGIRKELLSHGCPIIDWSEDTLWENHTGAFPRYPSSIHTFSVSRTLLAATMRKGLEQSNIEFVSSSYDGETDPEVGFTVFAGGQNFSLERFLGKVVERDRSYPVNLTYRSYLFSTTDLNMKGFKQYYFQVDAPLTTIGGVICPIEAGKSMVTLIENEKTLTPCPDYEIFLQKSMKMKSATFNEIIGSATPLSKLSTYRKSYSFLRSLNPASLSKNTVVLGDSLFSPNPVFGQGMTVALKEALLLKKMLESHSFSADAFYRQCAEIIKTPALLSLLGSQERGGGKKLLRSYLRGCQGSRFLHHCFLKQLHSLSLNPL